MPHHAARRTISSLLLLSARLPAAELGAGYDPLAVTQGRPEQKDLAVKDGRRSRDIPIRVYLPEARTPVPVVLFSHGLGGTREGCAYLGRHWALPGNVAIFLQHPGSGDPAARKWLDGDRVQDVLETNDQWQRK